MSDRKKKPTTACVVQMERIISRIEAWQYRWRDHTDTHYISSIKTQLIRYANELGAHTR